MGCDCSDYGEMGCDGWTASYFGGDPICDSNETLDTYDGCFIHDITAQCGACYYSFYSYSCPDQEGCYLECGTNPMIAN